MPQVIPMVGSAIGALGGAKAVATAGASIVGGVLSRNASNSASRNAAQAQVDAADRAAQVQRQNFQDMMAMLQPRIRAGDTAIGQMMFELGLSPQPGIPGVNVPAQTGGMNYGTVATGGVGGGGVGAGRGAAGSVQAYAPALTVPQGLGGMAAGGPRDGNMSAMRGLEMRGQFNTLGEGGQGGYPPAVRQYMAANGGQVPTQEQMDAYTGKRPVQDTDVPAADRFARFRETPGYQFQLTEGTRALEGSAAARGGLLRGSQLARLQEFGQGLADQTYGEYYNRLAALAGMGQTATSQAAGLGTATAGNLANIYQGAGDARASSYLTQGATNAGMIGNIGSALGGLNWGNLFGSK